jgi:hypothetical protein
MSRSRSWVLSGGSSIDVCKRQQLSWTCRRALPHYSVRVFIHRREHLEEHSVRPGTSSLNGCVVNIIATAVGAGAP